MLAPHTVFGGLAQPFNKCFLHICLWASRIILFHHDIMHLTCVKLQRVVYVYHPTQFSSFWPHLSVLRGYSKLSLVSLLLVLEDHEVLEIKLRPLAREASVQFSELFF